WQAIKDIIVQHHGTDLVHFFYHRALEMNNQDQGAVHSDDFRYPGPRPQSKEAGIVMLADAAEAVTRAMPQPTPAKIRDVVAQIVNNKFIDGQLEECPLTLKELHVIIGVFCHILNGIYHTRVAYPNKQEISHEQDSDPELAEKNAGEPPQIRKNGTPRP
ncbi:MAG: HD family phosphohydrolase, partial [Candidatus Omnitrophica bacterium]|nr:HD family phosphohydrolase [Candidatus Omnitrophota bacterium]